MNFQDLLAKMAALDAPVSEAPAAECGEMGAMPSMAPPMERDAPPPSMSVNLNAQGMDNIEDMLKLITKVNPDMAKPAMPPMGMPGLPPMGEPDGDEMGMPKIMSIKPINKLLPDFDDDNDDMPGGEKDHMEPDGDEGPEPKMASDDDGDEKKEKDEEFANEPDTDVKDVDYMNNKLAGGMNRPKDTFPKVSDGDNPMKKNKFESGDLRAQIRAELLQRLAEAKGAQ